MTRLARLLPLVLAFTLPLRAQTGNQIGKSMQATGAMDVELKPDAATTSYGRLLLTKHYHGPLEATSVGEMLTGGDPKAGNAGYVALETVSGTLDGRSGTFQLMHWGTIQSGKQDLRISVVPGSATGALHGLTGTLKIDIAPGGKHTYTLDYSLP